MFSMERDETEHGVAFKRAGLENSLYPEEEGDVTEEPTLEELGGEDSGQDVEGVVEAYPDEMEEEDTISVD